MPESQEEAGAGEVPEANDAKGTQAAQSTNASAAGTAGAAKPSSAPAGTPAAGAFCIWTAEDDGSPLLEDTDGKALDHPQPRDTRAVEIYFGILDGPPPPADQVELQGGVEKLLAAVRQLYLEGDTPKADRFRRYYVRLFQLAQLGLEGANPPTAMVRTALEGLTQDLIDDEAARVKNGHLRLLGEWVVRYGLYGLYAYVVFSLMPAPLAALLKERMALDCAQAANFMLLWVGCFIGVWLSYGIRTAQFTLADLTRTDSDRLQPQFRLIFIGTLTMLLGLLFSLGIVELKLGTYALSDIGHQPMLALLIGTFCGISEAVLPGSLAQKASAFVGSVK
jgi:hypothetical protein